MKLFRDYVMSWKQIGALKLYVLIIGLLLGSHFHETIAILWTPLVVVFAVLMVYFVYELLTDGFRRPTNQI